MFAHHPHFRCPSICTQDLWQCKIGVDSEIGRIVGASHITNEDGSPILYIDIYDLLMSLPFNVSYCYPKLVDTEV